MTAALHELTATRCATLIAAGELTSVELTEHYLERIRRLDGELGAYHTVLPDLALDQASRADDAARRSRRPLGPLHGVPVAVKDNLDVEDVVTSWGCAAFDEEADGDDNVVTRLKDAHLPILGKTELPELALPCHTENDLGGRTRNPWDPRRSPGGSSGGSAAAVGAGLAPLAVGTDAGGSIRIPAACCGVLGLRPSTGRVSNGPSDYAPTGLSTPGPMARSVPDLAALLQVLTGLMPGDLTTCRPAPARRTAYVGVATAPMTAGGTVDPVCVAAVQGAAAVLERAGYAARPVELGEDTEITEAFRDVWSVVAASFEVDDERSLTSFTRFLREHGRQVPATRLHQCLSLFRGVARMMHEVVFGSVDLLLTPAVATTPPELGEFRSSADEAANYAAMARFMPFTPLANIAGLPSLSVPLPPADGLPRAVLLTGAPGSDELLLRVADVLLRGAAAPHAPGWNVR